MKMTELLQARRSVYALDKDIPVDVDQVIQAVKDITELVPDAFNMKSQRVVIALGEKQEQLWDAVYDAFGGQVNREKVDSFKAGHGTVLFFTDETVVKGLQEQFPLYADNFPVWAQQSNGMLQLAVWTGLRELGLGASLQHYNPIINEAVQKLFGVPAHYALVAQMPFGRIVQAPDPKAKEDINQRVRVVK